MASLKYKVIASKTQYRDYTEQLETLVFSDLKTKETKDEIELLTALIDKWDTEHFSFKNLDPIQLLRSLMIENNLKDKDLVEILGLTKGLVSEILNYKKGLSKDVIRKLSEHFKVNQEAFNRPYHSDAKKQQHLSHRRIPSAKKNIAI